MKKGGNGVDDMDMMYECFKCGTNEVVKANDHRKDGRVCKKCGGHMSPLFYVIVGIDFASESEPDKTVWVYPPVEKNEKL